MAVCPSIRDRLFCGSQVSIIITLDALLESDLLGMAAGLLARLHLYP